MKQLKKKLHRKTKNRPRMSCAQAKEGRGKTKNHESRRPPKKIGHIKTKKNVVEKNVKGIHGGCRNEDRNSIP
jgi:hypothetical protein